jgi:hypothetical protein
MSDQEVGGARELKPCRSSSADGTINAAEGDAISSPTAEAAADEATPCAALRNRQIEQSSEWAGRHCLPPTSSMCVPELRPARAASPSATLTTAGTANCNAANSSVRNRTGRDRLGVIWGEAYLVGWSLTSYAAWPWGVV